MEKVSNPFIVKGKIPSPYFCDREQETEKIVRWIRNNNNIVLVSSRRIGKTKLIDHCFEQPAVSEQFYTVFVDILQTNNLQELTYELGKAVFDAFSTRSRRLIDLFLQTVKSIHGEFGFNPIDGLPKLSFSLGQINNPTYTLDEIFQFIEQLDKPCILAIDEFQRIAQYPETNIEAILRTYIQRMNNCGFMFAGSERHLLSQMFQDKNRPFYDSARILPLEKINKDKYIEFAVSLFEQYGKHITPELAARVYDLYNGNTFAMQKTMNAAFALTNHACTIHIIHSAIEEILEDSDYEYRSRLMLVSTSQKEVLYAIARTGIASRVTSSAFIGKHKLTSASSVQSAIRKLLADGWISETIIDGTRHYQLNDLFLCLWIQKKYGMGYQL